jgi:hypothetical protein
MSEQREGLGCVGTARWPAASAPCAASSASPPDDITGSRSGIPNGEAGDCKVAGFEISRVEPNRLSGSAARCVGPSRSRAPRSLSPRADQPAATRRFRK